MFQLSDTEREELLQLHRQERDKKVGDRIKVILLFDKGWEAEQIAEAIFSRPSTIKRHLDEYREKKKLQNKQVGGSESKLTAAQTEELVNHLELFLYVKAEAVQDHIAKTYGIEYSLSGLKDWLHRNGFSYKRGNGLSDSILGKPAKADSEAQEQFIAEYEALKKKVSKGTPILFMDSSHPTQATKIGYGWIRTGKKKEILTTAGRERVNITGAINIRTRQVISATYKTVNGESTVNFLEKILKNHPGRRHIHVIIDCSGYHRSDVVKKFIEKNKRLKVHFLPPYSPNLNPIERLWKVMNEHVRNNRFFSTAKEFREAIATFFSDTIPQIHSILEGRINDKFQRLRVST